MRKLVRTFNLLAIAVVLTFAAFTWWIAIRPLAQTSGSISLPVHGPARVTRDELGVAHIEAASIEDAIFIQGYVTAQDRMWQMDALRRLAAGELADVLGPAALESDRDARRLRLKRVAEQHARSLAAQDRNLLVAYARGVNTYLQHPRGRLPVEFTLLGYDPHPWSVADSILAALQMYRSLTNTHRTDMLKKVMLGKGEPAMVDALFPPRTGQELSPGSNAWAISGRHTATGKPILANDTHLEWSFPSAWYSVHLKAPGLNAIGFALPGLPCVMIGHNQNIAWGVTNLHFDVQDLYREQMSPATGQYAFQGKTEPARFEREFIRVKTAQTVEQSQWVTRHGPVIHNANNEFYSLRWTAAEPGGFQYPMLEVNQAADWESFRRALSRFTGPGQNFIYADTTGNIGHQVAGKLPIRHRYQGDIPVEGNGDYEWDGFIPFEELPSSYNPPSGFIVTANQNPFPARYAHAVSGNFAPHYRSRQIAARLQARHDWKPADQLDIQKDVYSAYGHWLARTVASVFDRKGRNNPSLAPAARILKNFDGQMRAGSPAPFLVVLIDQQLRRAIADRASSGQGAAYESQMAPAVIDQLLTAQPRQWFGDYDALVLRCFVDALDEGKKLQGNDIPKWDYGRHTSFLLVHPVLSRVPFVNRVPWLGSYLRGVGPVPMHGASTTVKQTSRRLGPSMRFVADLSSWEGSLHNVTIGQSGQAFSTHFRDQWDAYYRGTSFRMQFGKIEGKDVLNIFPAGSEK